MSLLRSLLALVLCVSCAAACGDNWERGDDFGSADASVSFPDAAGFPDAGRPDAEPESDPLDDLACSIEEILPIVECVFTNCLDSFSDGTALTCVALNCGLLLLGLSPECSQCVLAGLADPSSALDSCLLGSDDPDFPMPPTP